MITNQALYQLSYSSTWARIIRPRPGGGNAGVGVSGS